MAIRHFPRRTAVGRIEEVLHDMFTGLDCKVHVVAVEIFDHDEAAWDPQIDATTGPWVLGPEEEVMTWLEAAHYYEHDTQYEHIPQTMED